MASAQAQSNLKKLRMFRAPHVKTHMLDHHYHVLSFCHQEKNFIQKQHEISGIRIQKGRLFLDDLPILKPHFGHDMITWNQQIKGHYTSGHLFFQRNGAELHGIVYRGTNALDATEHHVLATTIPTVDYVTQISKTRYPLNTDAGKVPADGWETGLKLSISYEMAIGDNIPTPKVSLNDEDITDSTSWSIDPKTQQLQLILNLDSSLYCMFGSYYYLKGIVAFDQLKPLPTFVGTITSTCKDQQGDGAFIWKGEVEASANQLQKPGLLKAPRAFAPMELSHTDLLADSNLSVAQLMSIVPDDSVSSTANDMLVENMKWAMAQDSTEKDWLSEFFGQLPPVLPKNRQDLVSRSMGWYQQDFSKAYLGWSVANYDGPNKPSNNLDDAQKLKLKNFLQTGMAANKDFNIQQNGIYLDAFIAAKPDLQRYIADGGEKWANALYSTITSSPQLILMVNRIWGASGQQGAMTPANNFATLLNALQPSGDLAKQYIGQVTAGCLSNASHQSTFKDQDTIMEWLPEFLQEFLNKVATGGSVPDQAKIVAEQLKLMLEDQGNKMTNVAMQLAEFVINANGANIMEKTANMESAFAQKFPRFAKVGQMMFFTAWCMGIIFVVKAFQNWKDLKPLDKAKAITTAITLGFQALDVIPQFLSGIKSMGVSGWQKFTQWRNSLNTNKKVIEVNEIVEGEGWVKQGATETSALFDTATSTVKTAGTLWEKAFAFASKVVAVVGVLASVAFSVYSAIEFINDIKDGEPITKIVFDGLMLVVNVATTICLVLDLFVATTVFAMAAAVLAVIGIIITIIAMFVVKPKNPLETFMDNVVKPFVNGLPEQHNPPSVTQMAAVSLL